MNTIEKRMVQDIMIRKRSGVLQEVCYDKIDMRIKNLINDKDLGKLENVSVGIIVRDVIGKVIDGISSSELDILSSQLCNDNCMKHPDYGVLAKRIAVSNLHKNTTECFSETMEGLYNNKNPVGEHTPRLSLKFINSVREHKEVLNSAMVYKRDYLFNYFGFKTLEHSYLLKKFDKNGKEVVTERPQHYLMRIALALHSENISDVITYYNISSQLYFTHGSPTIFNAGTDRQQLSSCFTMNIEDSMEGIYDGLKKCALISKNGGGIGVSASEIRPKNSYIKGTNGRSDGLVKPLKVFNETARFSNQGSRRNGSFAVYLEPWHSDIFEFLELKKNIGKEENRARDLFYAMWIPDLFMKAVENDTYWYLMGHDTNPGLTDSYGEEFDELYNKYVKDGNYRSKVKAREIWSEILISQMENGMPYIMYKDQVNKKSNQQNAGMIKCGNLCAEEVEIVNKNEVSVCNISTVSLPKFVDTIDNKKVFNHQKLFDTVKIVTVGMDHVIDVNFYPIPETKTSNINHRPIMIGAQGLSNCFFEMDLVYSSEEAQKLNKEIYETIHYAALTSSCELAKKYGKYSTFEGSPASKGMFQHNMWGLQDSEAGSGRWDWSILRKNVMEFGLRNSLVTASPPTASTSQILGNYESFEPIMNNIFMREVLGGTYPIVNNYLINDLIKIDRWNQKVQRQITLDRGSVQNIKGISQHLKDKYLTTYEISQKVVIDMSADRGLFTDQSQSLNIYMRDPTIESLTSMHFYGWKKELKTGSYYLRSLAKAKAEQFTTADSDSDSDTDSDEPLMCTLEDVANGCAACSG
jgi:ribonucleoside-diphosphate reductase alpha subunit